MIVSPIVRKIVSSLVGGSEAASSPKESSGKPIGFVIFNIIFIGLLGYSIYLSSFIQSQQDSIKNLSGEISNLNKKVSAIEELKNKEVEIQSQIAGITSKIDIQKEELDEIKGLLESYKRPTDKHLKH
jgi:restriction endonuclease S subunit